MTLKIGDRVKVSPSYYNPKWHGFKGVVTGFNHDYDYIRVDLDNDEYNNALFLPDELVKLVKKRKLSAERFNELLFDIQSATNFGSKKALEFIRKHTGLK